SKLMKIPGIGAFAANAVSKSKVMDRAEQEIEFIEKNNIRPIFFTEEDYPKRLKHCDDSPILLYYKGNAGLNSKRIVAIVGTRNATDYGKELCKKLVEDLSALNVLI